MTKNAFKFLLMLSTQSCLLVQTLTPALATSASENDQDANDSWRNLQTGFRMDGSLSSKNEWTLQGDLFKNSGDQIVSPLWLATPPYVIADYSDYTAGGGNIIGSWQHAFTDNTLLRFNAYYDATHREESCYEQSFSTIDLDLQYEAPLGEYNSLTMGTGYRRISCDAAESFQVFIPEQTKDLYSAFIQDEIKLITDQLWLTLGTKYEHNDFTGNEWQPSARMLWKPVSDHRPRT